MGILSDVCLNVGMGAFMESIHAHHLMLAMSSPVFGAMFKDKVDTNWKKIDVPDVEPEAFKVLLKFIYTNEVKIGSDTVMTTLYAAKKYAVPQLEGACMDFLLSNITGKNAFSVLSNAQLISDSRVVNLCLETIDKNAEECFAGNGFTEVDVDTLHSVFKRNSLIEKTLFEAALRWATAACTQQISANPKNLRLVLGRVLFSIRFPLMASNYFAEHIVPSGLLTDSEVVEIFVHFTLNEKPMITFSAERRQPNDLLPRVASPPPSDNTVEGETVSDDNGILAPFVGPDLTEVHRKCTFGEWRSACRLMDIDTRYLSDSSSYNNLVSDLFSFITDRDIVFRGFGLYSTQPHNGCILYTVDFQLRNESSEVINSFDQSAGTFNGFQKPYRVILAKPIKINASTVYTVAVTVYNSPFTYCGKNALKNVTVVGADDSGKTTCHFVPTPPQLIRDFGSRIPFTSAAQVHEIVFSTCLCSTCALL